MSTSECFCSSKNQIGREVGVVAVVAQEHLGGRQRRPLGDGVHLDGLRLLVTELRAIELRPRNVLLHVPADGLELLEEFGVQHGGLGVRARVNARKGRKKREEL